MRLVLYLYSQLRSVLIDTCLVLLMSLCFCFENFRDICDLADKHQAVVFVDDCHSTGFFGPTGRSVGHCYISTEYMLQEVFDR